MQILIKTIRYEEAKDFLKKQKANKEQISINGSCDLYYGAICFDILIGIVGTQKINKKIRIKQFYVDKSHRYKGVGSLLIKKVIDNEEHYTCYATLNSFKIFLKYGFLIKSKNNYNITYMEKANV